MWKAWRIWLCFAVLLAANAPAFAEGDATKGKAAYAKCAVCHQIGPGAKTLVGPELNGIVGRQAAAVTDYASYSPGLKQLGTQNFIWSQENLDKWIADPKAIVPDSPMSLSFQGIADAQERADIIAYLKTVLAQ
jgi:cytochrome c